MLNNSLLQTAANFAGSTFSYLSGCSEYNPEDRFRVHGLPVSIIAGMAGAYLLSGPGILIGGVFGAVNYLAITILSEMTYYAKTGIDQETKIAGIFTICHFATKMFIGNILMTPLSQMAALTLTISSVAGILFREYLLEKNKP